MRIIHDLKTCPTEYKNAVIALGNFDGVHLGHQAIVKECIRIAKKENAPAAVMTFEPHPREFFGQKNIRLYPFDRKVELLRALGVDALFILKFDQATAALSAQAFIDMLQTQLAAKHIVTGTNFAFGKNRAGNTELLASAGFGFTACPPVKDEKGNIISSSAIREALTQGDVKAASSLLGRAYNIEGSVQHGDKRGRELGYPTINLPLTDLFIPRFGIYAARVQVDGAWHEAVANLGIRPMFESAQPLLEAHMFDISADMYGKQVRVELTRFIREEQRFDSIERLKSQMAADCVAAKEAHRAHR